MKNRNKDNNKVNIVTDIDWEENKDQETNKIESRNRKRCSLIGENYKAYKLSKTSEISKCSDKPKEIIPANVLVNSVFINKENLLISACDSTNKLLVEDLLACDDVDVNQVDHNGNTALIKTAAKGQIEILKLLLYHADTNVNTVATLL